MAEELSSQADQLQSTMSYFKVRDGEEQHLLTSGAGRTSAGPAALPPTVTTGNTAKGSTSGASPTSSDETDGDFEEF